MSLPDVHHITPLKDSTGFHMWWVQIKVLLEKEGLLEVVEGKSLLSTIKADDTQKLSQWKVKDATAKHYIFATTDMSVKQHLVSCDTSADMYSKMQSIFENDSDQQKCILYQQFYSYCRNPSMSMFANASTVEEIANRLKALKEPMPETMIVTRILGMLPPADYRGFKAAWDNLDAKLRTTQELLKRLQKDESNEPLIPSTSTEQGNVCFSTVAPRANPKCFRCGKEGHQIRFCPEGKYKSKQRHNNNSRDTSKPQKFNPCRYCKFTNHLEDNCNWHPVTGKYTKANKRKADSKPPAKQESDAKRAKHEKKVAFMASSENKKVSPTVVPRPHEADCIEVQNQAASGRNISFNVLKNTSCFRQNAKCIDKSKLSCNSQIDSLCAGRNCSLKCCVNTDYLSLFANDAKVKNSSFCADSGCNAHMTNNRELLTNVRNVPGLIKVAKKDNFMQSVSVGTVESDTFKLKNTLLVPELTRNLLSVPAVTEHNAAVIFNKKEVKILKQDVHIPSDMILARGPKTPDGLFMIDITPTKTSALMTTKNTDVDLWHRKMGHLSFPYLKKLPNMCNGLDVHISEEHLSKKCEICVKAKQTRSTHNTVRRKETEPLRLIHTDVCGPFKPTTYDNKAYFLTFIDDCTHFCTMYLLEKKSDVFSKLRQFIMQAENFWNKRVYKIRCDNGGEYINTACLEWCKERGTVMDPSSPYTPLLNGTAERMNRTIEERMRALLFESGLAEEMWGEAALTAVYLINRSPTSAVKVLPAESWYRKRIDFSNIHVFGSPVYAKVKTHLSKLQSRSTKAVFVGYGSNGLRLWDPRRRVTFMSSDVTFLDTTPEKLAHHKDLELVKGDMQDSYLLGDTQSQGEDTPLSMDNIMDNIFPNEDQETLPESTAAELDDEMARLTDNLASEEAAVDDIPSKHVSVQPDATQERKYNLRRRDLLKAPVKFNDYVVDHGLQSLYVEALLCSSEETPSSYLAAEKNKKWLKAIEEEKAALDKSKVWDLVDRKEAYGSDIVSSRWLFKIKDNGVYRARLVARGYQQTKTDFDFKDLYSPVVDTVNLRTLFSLAAQRRFHIKTFDVKTAFLNGDLDTKVYMEVPEGYEGEGKVCLLKKALYGLNQAPLRWFKRLSVFLTKIGLSSTKSDRCIFKNSEGTLYLAVYVDDGVIMSQDTTAIDCILEKLQIEFEVVVNNSPTSYVGFQIDISMGGIFLHQTKYAESVLRRFRMEDSNPACTPLESYTPQEENKKNRNTLNYRQVVGSLLYLSCKTRPDIAFAVNYASRFVENPSSDNDKMLRRILRYLRGTTNVGIKYSNLQCRNNLTMQVFSDSDHAGSGIEGKMKSTSGFVIMFGGGPVTWCSRKQDIVATSSAEAEYIAAAECCKELQYLSTLTQELTNIKPSATFHVDNSAAVSLIKSGKMNKRSRHINIKYYFISEKLDEGLFKLKHCPSAQQLADIFTKPLKQIKFQSFVQQLCCSIPVSCNFVSTLF